MRKIKFQDNNILSRLKPFVSIWLLNTDDSTNFQNELFRFKLLQILYKNRLIHFHLISQTFDLENEGQGHGGKKRDLHRSSRNVRWDIVDFVFQNLS